MGLNLLLLISHLSIFERGSFLVIVWNTNLFQRKSFWWLLNPEFVFLTSQIKPNPTTWAESHNNDIKVEQVFFEYLSEQIPGRRVDNSWMERTTKDSLSLLICGPSELTKKKQQLKNHKLCKSITKQRLKHDCQDIGKRPMAWPKTS